MAAYDNSGYRLPEVAGLLGVLPEEAQALLDRHRITPAGDTQNPRYDRLQVNQLKAVLDSRKGRKNDH